MGGILRKILGKCVINIAGIKIISRYLNDFDDSEDFHSISNKLGSYEIWGLSKRKLGLKTDPSQKSGTLKWILSQKSETLKQILK